jgi:hypothetical protein
MLYLAGFTRDGIAAFLGVIVAALLVVTPVVFLIWLLAELFGRRGFVRSVIFRNKV